jgi:hypothetical protein
MSIASDGTLSGTPTVSGNFTPAFSVLDTVSGVTGTANIPLTINAGPTITDPSPLPSGVLAAVYGYQFGSSFPVSGGTPAYSWSSSSQLPPGLGLAPDGTLSGTPSQTGLFTFSVQVTDALGSIGSKTFALVIGTLPVQVSTLRAPPPSTIGVPYPPPPPALQAPYFRAARGTGSYTWTSSGLPEGVFVSPANTPQVGLAGTPTASGSFLASVTATDPLNESDQANFTLVINPAPAINTTPLQPCTAGTACTRTLSVSGGTPGFIWSLVPGAGSVPAGMSFSTAGVISGQPSAVTSPTTSSFTAKATDSATAFDAQPLSLIVNPAIVLSPATLPPTSSGLAYSQTLTTTGGTGTITLAATGLPGWLSLQGNVLSGTAPSVPTPASFPFSVKATDANNASTTNSYIVVVNPVPTITTASPLPAWTVNRPYSQNIAATGGTGTLTIADNGATLPGWLTVTPAGLLSGTPPTAGPVNFTLKVTDSVGASTSKAFALTINPSPAVTTTTLPQTTSLLVYNQTLTETGGTSPFTWQAVGLPGWLALSNLGVLSGTAPTVTQSTAYSFSVTVTDNAGAVSPSQNLSVTVNPAIQITNTSPLPPTTSGLSYGAQFAATGGTGTVTFTSTNLPGWLTLTPAGGLSGTAPAVATQYPFDVTARDAVNAFNTKTFSVTVNPVPAITTASPLPPWTVNRPYAQNIAAVGGTGTLTIADNGATLPNWLTVSAAGLFSGTPPAAGPVNFTLKVTDTLGAGTPKAFALTINPPPVVTTTTLPQTTSLSIYSQQLTESGGTSPFSWQGSGLPGWLSLSSGGVLSGTAPVVASSTNFNFAVTVTDNAGAVSASQNLTVTVNPPVQITTGGTLPPTTSGLSYSATIAATGGIGTITFASSNLPGWLTLTPAGGLSGIAPSVLSPTQYPFDVTARDTVNGTNTKSFSVTVNPLPTITTSSPLPAWTVNRPYSQNIAAAGGTGALTISDNGATLPAWLTVSAAGLLGGTPPAAGPVSFTLKVTDSLGATTPKAFALTINPAPSVTTTTLPQTTSLSVYSQQLAESGGTSPLTWQASGLPGWLSISTAGVLAGTAPSVTQATPFNFSVTVTDSAGAVSAPQALSVTVNPAIQITSTSPLPPTTSGLSYAAQFAATGGTGTTTFTSANLPGWLTLTAAGGLSGTAPAVASATPYPFDVTARDAIGAFNTKTFNVTVNPLPAITNASPLPPWTVNRPYGQNIAATGGTGALTIADNGSTLPNWLTINSGLLSGTPPAAGPVSFTLKVTDTLGASTPKAFALTINPPPTVTTTTLPPTTSLGVYSQTLINSGGTSPFSWQGSGLPAWLSLSAGGALSGTAPAVAAPTIFSFSVTVTDNAGAVSAPQNLSVTVNPALRITTNQLPPTESGLSYSQTFTVGGGVGTDTWSSANLPSWLTLSAAGVLSGTAPAVTAATPFSFNITVTDTKIGTATQGFTITVFPAVAITTALTLPPWTVNRPYTQTITAAQGNSSYTFADNGATLPIWLAVNAAGVLSGTPPTAGQVSFTLKVTDGIGGVATRTFALTINPAPSITTTSLPPTTSGRPYSQTLAETGGTAGFTFSTTNLPTWLTLNGTTLSGTAPAVGAATPFTFTVTVTDSTGAASAPQTLTVTVNPAVTITTASPLPAVASNTFYSQTFTATGGTGTIAWTFANLPSWLLQNGATLSGVSPTVTQPAPFTFSATATDTVGSANTKSFTVTVGSGVTITTNPSQGPWTATIFYSVTLTATGGTPPYTFKDAGSTLPSWLTLNGATLSGTPPSAFNYQFAITATDFLGAQGTTSFTLPVNPVPAVTATSLPATTSGLQYLQTLSATGGTLPLTWNGNNVPGWLTLSGPVLSGVAPVVSSATQYPFSVSVTDFRGASTQPQAFTVTVNPPVTITTAAPLPQASPGVAYSVAFAASGGTGALTWTASGLPAWLGLSGNTVSGTPPISAIGIPVTLTIRATDTLGAYDFRSYPVTVGSAPPAISGNLPAWTVNRPYSANLTASGGTPPYKNWSVASGALPGGLQVDPTTGAITGTPTSVGTASFTIGVTDSKGVSGSTPYTLQINPAPAIPQQNLPSAAPGSTYSQAVTETGGTPPFSWIATGLSGTGLSLTPTGTLTGVPTATPPATISFSASLTDATGAAAQGSVSLTVAPGVSITTSGLPQTTSTAQYTASLSASGGTGTIAFSALPNSLPAWLSLTPKGALAGVAPLVPATTDFNFVATATDSLGIAVSKAFSVTVNPPPKVLTVTLPTGTAGAPYSVQLSGNGGTGALTWSGQNLPAWASLNASSGVISGTPPSASSTTFSVVVRDSLQIASQAASLTVIINAPGGVPAITTSCPFAPTTAGIAVSRTVTAAGGFPAYSWSASGLPAWLSLTPSGALSGTAVAGAAAFTLQVTDSKSQPASLGCGITVNPLPAITSGPLAPGTAGAPYAQGLSASDGTGPLIWSAQTLPDWLALDPLTGALKGSPTTAGTYGLSVQVTDSLGAVSLPASFVISVTSPGGTPFITACPLPSGSAGSPLSFQLTAALGFPPYQWGITGLPGTLSATATGLVSGTPAAVGSYSVTMAATDAANVTVNATCQLNIFSGLSVTTTSLPDGTVGAPYSQTLAATGGVGALQWSGSGLPAWLSLDPNTGIVSGTPTATGSYPFSVQVIDSLGSRSTSAPLTINVAAPGGGLTISTACPLPDITESMLISTTFTAHGGTPPYNWTATGLPAGVSFSAAGALSGAPAAGSISFSVQAADQQKQTVSSSCSLRVNPKPAISTTSIPDGSTGTPYSAPIAARGGTGKLQYQGGLPYWLSIDAASGLLSGTPPSAGGASALVRVSDALGIADSKAYSFSIAAQSSSPSPALTSACPLPAATAGVSYSLTQTAAGGVPPYRFFVSGLPPGLAYSSSGGITGVALAGGTVQVVVEVIDAKGATATALCSLAIAPPLPLKITSSTPDGKVNQSYSGAFSASGGIPPFTWSIATGSLPPGLVLDPASGSLSGAPTAAGPYTFQVQVTDITKTSATAGGAINVAASLFISTPPSLPDATGGISYRLPLLTSSAVGTVSWSIVSGALPSGLTLDPVSGVISGAATVAGPFQFTVQAMDSAGQPAQQKFTLAVVLAPLPPVTITGLTNTLAPAQQLTAGVALASPYPLDIVGQLNLSVTPDSSINVIDPAVLFAPGGGTVSFRIAAGSVQATFAQTPAFQTGTVAGTLKLDVTLQTGGQNVLPPSSAAISGQLARLAPVVVGAPSVTRTANGIQVSLIGFATSREVTSATFHFTGTNLQSTDINVPLSSLLGGWFSDPQSIAFGSTFKLVQQFTVQGATSQVTGVTITLTNAIGSSTPVSVNF